MNETPVVSTGPKQIDWKAVKRWYISTPDSSVDKGAEKFDVSASLIVKHSSEEGWVEKKKEMAERIDRKFIETLPETIAKIAADRVKVGQYLYTVGTKKIKEDAEKGLITQKTALSAINSGFTNVERAVAMVATKDDPNALQQGGIVNIYNQYNIGGMDAGQRQQRIAEVEARIAALENGPGDSTV